MLFSGCGELYSTTENEEYENMRMNYDSFIPVVFYDTVDARDYDEVIFHEIYPSKVRNLQKLSLDLKDFSLPTNSEQCGQLVAEKLIHKELYIDFLVYLADKFGLTQEAWWHVTGADKFFYCNPRDVEINCANSLEELKDIYVFSF